MATTPKAKWEELFRSLNRQQKITLLSIVVAPLISLAVYFVKTGSFDSVYFALTLSVTWALFVDRLSRMHFENDTVSELRKFGAKDNDLQYLKDTATAVNWFCKNCADLQSVDNTIFYRFAVDRRQRYTNSSISKFVASIKAAIDDGCTWTDVVTADQRSASEDFYETLTPQQKGHYTSAFIDTNLPLLQMMLLRYNEGPSAVLFGWGFVGGTKTTVYVSHGQETVEYFTDYFEALWSKSRELHTPTAIPQGAGPKLPPRP